MVNAEFLFVLSLARIFSLRDYTKIRMANKKMDVQKIKYRNYFNNGILLIFLVILYFFVSIYMYYNGTNTIMHEYLTYLVALISFWSIGIIYTWNDKIQKENTPIIKAVKITNFASSLTSLVLTQVVLLDTFSKEEYISNWNGYTGMVVSLIILVLGFYMIVSSKIIMNK